MSPERWTTIEALLDAALDLPADERATLLADPTTGDQQSRDEVKRLLGMLDEAERFLEQPAAEYAAPLFLDENESADAPAPARIGPYRIVGEAGRGGMGTVYLAERDDEEFRMQVALKVVPRGLATEHALRRFREERQILASLEHPHIARLLDGGVTDGAPWFAMEYVEGVPIDRFCDAHHLTIDARLRLFRTVCDAVQYAHRKLVVHRDLKPSNLLVTDDGEAKLLDFGIARLLDPLDAPLDPAATRTGARLLTPEYASPEQVRGEMVGTTSDVYSLGVLLYLLLSGRSPYAGDTRRPHELGRAILEIDPERPSAVAPPTLRRQLRGDLDTIVLRALQKEPERRYGSVQALSNDIGRHLDGLPVRARPDTAPYRAGKFLRRNRGAVAAAAVLVLSLLGGLLGTAWQARAASREAERAEAVRDFLIGLFQASDPGEARGDEITARELLDRGEAAIHTDLMGQPGLRAEMLGVLGVIYRDLGSYDRAEPLLRQAAAVWRTRSGARHAKSATAQHELAQVLLLMGRHEEAEALHRQALDARRSLFHAQHPDVGSSLAALAAVLGERGDYEQAERLNREALAIQIRHAGPDHTSVADALEQLGSILRAKGDLAEAEVAWRQALDMRSRLLGPDHLATATATNNLALLLSDRDDLAEAATLYRQVLEFDLRRLGEEHPYTATVMNNLASVLRRQGDLDEAERLYRRALDIDRRLHGDAHPKVATVLNNLAAVLRDRGDYAESERLYRAALATFRQANGDGHPSVGTAHSVLATVLYLRGDTAGAEAMYRQALGILRRAFPEGHIRTSSTLVGLGRLLTERGGAAEAEPLLSEALEIRIATFGDDHSRSTEARVELGACILRLERFAEAEELLLQSRTALDPPSGWENQRTLRRANEQLIALYDATGRGAEATQLRAAMR